MSEPTIGASPARLQRSVLSVPASRPELFPKALHSDADCIFLDLEDSVAAADKETARTRAIDGLREHEWRARGKTISVRVNGLDTPFMYRDLIDVVEAAGDCLDTIIIPKVASPGDVHLVDVLLTQIEEARGLRNRIGIEVLIESALGMVNIDSIAQSSRRLEALHFGVADFAASLRARTTNIGGLAPDYPGDPWHAALARLTLTCRAYGLRPIDGPYGDFADDDGYVAAARRAATLGVEGKWAIHPSQVALANEVFTPTREEVDLARRILRAVDDAAAAGRGAAQLDGKMIDGASARLAQNLVMAADKIQARRAPALTLVTGDR
jgi:malyl-CoA/(S)-citramalyl-CoA lyase